MNRSSETRIIALAAVVVGFATTSSAQTNNPGRQVFDATDAQLRALSELKPLPKTHYSWPINKSHLDHRVTSLWLDDFVRITHAATIDVEDLTRLRVEMLVRICQAQKGTLALKMSPWHEGQFFKDKDPTLRGDPEAKAATAILERLSEFRRLVADANRLARANVEVSAILFDTEIFELKKPSDPAAKGWNAAMRIKYDAAYDCAKRIFPDAYVDWYGRGWMRFFAIARTTGWGRSTWFDLTEKGDGASAVLYRLPMIDDSIECFRRTVSDSRAHGIKKVVPWLGIGCGYHPDEAKKNVVWDGDWGYSPAVAARFGYEVNHQFLEAPFANFYPGPGQNSHWFEHFIAYCEGAQAKSRDELPKVAP